jgi:hypothetical protein
MNVCYYEVAGVTLGSVHEAPSWNPPYGDPSVWQALPGRFALPSPVECHHFHISLVGGFESHPCRAVTDTATRYSWYRH